MFVSLSCFTVTQTQLFFCEIQITSLYYECCILYSSVLYRRRLHTIASVRAVYSEAANIQLLLSEGSEMGTFCR